MSERASGAERTWESPVPMEVTRTNLGMRPCASPLRAAASIRAMLPLLQGLTLAHFKAQLEDLRDTSVTLERNMSTFGTRPRVNLGYMEDNVSFS